MRDDIKVIDADIHVTETEEDYRKVLEEPFNRWGGPLRPADNYNRSIYGKVGKDVPLDPSIQLKDMDQDGIDIGVIFTSLGVLGMLDLTTKKIASPLARAHNNLLAKFCKADPLRLKGTCLVNPYIVKEAVQELKRGVSMGLVGCGLPSMPLGINFGDEKFDPLYEAAQDLDVPMLYHVAKAGVGGAEHWFDDFSSVHALNLPFKLMGAYTAVIAHGVLERFPRLRVAFLEAGVGWVPYMMERLDREYDIRAGEDWPQLRRKPSEYIKDGRVYFTCETEEQTLPYVMKFLGEKGEDVVMFSSDYPHWDTEWPHASSSLFNRTDISYQQKSKIFYYNPVRLYRIK